MKISDKSLYLCAAVFLVLVFAVSVSSDVIEMMCLDDVACGPTGFVGEEYCLDGDKYKNYTTSICMNPGQDDSACSIDVVPTLIQNCDDDNPLTLDSCVEGDDVSCSHEFVACVDDGDCEQGYCNENDLCVFDEVECLIDETCGVATSEFICLDDDRYEETVTPVCSEGHSCDVNVNQDFVESCEFGCELGECLSAAVECEVDIDCLTGEVCNENNQCEVVQCSVAGDCGDVEISLSCEGSDVVEIIVTPVCGDNECSVISESEFVESCDEDCDDGECVRERFDRENDFFNEYDEAFFEALMMDDSRGQNIPQYILFEEQESDRRIEESGDSGFWFIVLILALIVLIFIFLLVLYLMR